MQTATADKKTWNEEPLHGVEGAKQSDDKAATKAPESGRTKGVKGKPYGAQVKAVRTDGAKGRPDEVGLAQQAIKGKGSPLPHKAALEARLGRSLDGVIAHTDEPARDAARDVGAKAFAIGNHIVFADAAPDIETVAHEVTHVLQQMPDHEPGAEQATKAGEERDKATDPKAVDKAAGQAGGGEALKAPTDAKAQKTAQPSLGEGALEQEAKAAEGGASATPSASPVALMKDPTTLLNAAQVESALRYNRSRGYSNPVWQAIQRRLETSPSGMVNKATIAAIAEWQKEQGLSVDGMLGPASLRKLDAKMVDNGQPEQEKPGEQAMQGTFSEDAVDGMRGFFEDNAKSAAPLPCITTMNKGLQKLYGKKLKSGSTVQDTMALMEKAGLVSDKKVFDFLNASGKVTTGIQEPVGHNESPARWLISQCKEPGLHVFGLSLMDGYHSITLTVDTRDPSTPIIYWSDQWRSHAGFAPHSASEFDAKVLKLTNSWWTNYKEEKGYPPRSRLTLWKLQAPAGV